MDNREKLLSDWKDADKAAREWKARENELRKLVIDAFSEETREDASGVENIDIGWGFDLKITHKLDYKLDNNDKVDDALDTIERTVESGKLIAERLISWKPTISVSEYKKLPADAKVLIDRVLTIKPASKAIEIKQRNK